MGLAHCGTTQASRSGKRSRPGVTRARLLWFLLALFAVRVVGQLLVVAGRAPFLPPMDEWQSGLLPYPLLLASQILILALFATVCVQFTREKGYFVRRHAWLATPLWISGGSTQLGWSCATRR